jgi:hypothetical protein
MSSQELSVLRPKLIAQGQATASLVVVTLRGGPPHS